MNDCCGRYATDMICDYYTNATLVAKGSRVFLRATTETAVGDEIFIPHGIEYWSEHLDELSLDKQGDVRQRLKVKEKRSVSLDERRRANEIIETKKTLIYEVQINGQVVPIYAVNMKPDYQEWGWWTRWNNEKGLF